MWSLSPLWDNTKDIAWQDKKKKAQYARSNMSKTAYPAFFYSSYNDSDELPPTFTYEKIPKIKASSPLEFISSKNMFFFFFNINVEEF